MSNKEERLIQTVIKQFDFVTVEYVMDKLEWVWCGHGVPDIQDLRNLAYDLLKTAIESVKESKSDQYEIQNGGLSAYAYQFDNDEIEVGLKFICTDYSHHEAYIK